MSAIEIVAHGRRASHENGGYDATVAQEGQKRSRLLGANVSYCAENSRLTRKKKKPMITYAIELLKLVYFNSKEINYSFQEPKLNMQRAQRWLA